MRMNHGIVKLINSMHNADLDSVFPISQFRQSPSQLAAWGCNGISSGVLTSDDNWALYYDFMFQIRKDDK